MRLANIASGATFRMALKLLAGFVVVLLASGYLLVSALSTTLENQTRAQLEEEAVLLSDIFKAQGQQGLIESVESLSARSKVFNHQLGLFDENKLHLGGSISLMPSFIGWQKTQLVVKSERRQQADDKDNTLNQKKSSQQYHVKVFKLDKLTLVVGRSSENIDRLVKQLISWLLAIGVVLSVVIVMLGFLASARSYAKLRSMSDVLRLIAQGSTSARIPTSTDNDQIDVIGRQMNEHLAHLEKLISGIQTTATAIAHDLKTPLSHAQIALFEAQELIDQQSDPQLQVATAQDKLDQLNQTFDTILRISRIQAHTDRSQFRRENISVLINNVIELLEPVAQQRDIELRVDIPASMGSEQLTCDKGMIQQLLINLINNALIHCPAKSWVKVGLVKDGNKLQLSVIDNGPGIPEGDRADIIKPFTRLSQSRTTQGNGLGLALVKAVVDQHKGSLELLDGQPGLWVVVGFDLG